MNRLICVYKFNMYIKVSRIIYISRTCPCENFSIVLFIRMVLNLCRFWNILIWMHSTACSVEYCTLRTLILSKIFSCFSFSDSLRRVRVEKSFSSIPSSMSMWNNAVLSHSRTKLNLSDNLKFDKKNCAEKHQMIPRMRISIDWCSSRPSGCKEYVIICII